MSRKIAITFNHLSDARMERIRAAAEGFELVFCDKGDEAIADCEAVFGHITPEMLGKAAGLRWLHTQSAGVDSYLAPESGLREDITLTNSAGAYGINIAEYTLTLTLMLLRQMDVYARNQPHAVWEMVGNASTLYGKLVTVVGLGDIGGRYAALCRALGAKVRGVTRTARSAQPGNADELFTADALDEAIANADIVALCLPGTPDTRRLFDRPRLLRLKPGSMLLNIGRGTAVDQDALIELLQSGHLAGAGLDVTDPEPLPASSPLWTLPGVILTPHVSGGASPESTYDLIVDKFAEYLRDYAAGRPFKYTVDRRVGY